MRTCSVQPSRPSLPSSTQQVGGEARELAKQCTVVHTSAYIRRATNYWTAGQASKALSVDSNILVRLCRRSSICQRRTNWR
ncbi:unnamed protein product, partial [Ceratitis capitata]